MDKVYDHQKHEKNIYKLWEDSKAFSPKKQNGKKPFTVIMPPPNANDPLHVGHARFVAIEDTLVRYHRLKGDPTLWLPGSDHAGIETQFVFEKKLREKGQSRFDFDRKTLYKMIWDYVEENTGLMQKQLRQLGASCDWSRHKFTLDPDIIKIVYKTFKKLSDDDFLERKEKLVNYCTHCGTAYSELEVDHVERNDPLYFVRFPKKEGYVTVATTRPETIYADTYLAINPKDKRYKHLEEEKITNPLSGKKMKIVKDSFVDPKFGTGIVKITPSHDFNDEIVGEKHNIPFVLVIGQNGKLTKNTGKYEGLYVKEARRATVKDLAKGKFIEKIDENYKHTISICYRCKSTIEPMPQEQWFVKIKYLAALGKKAIEDKKIVFNSKKYEKIALHWLSNLHDWNVSRQIVWGIQIPAWKCGECGSWTITEGETPKNCDKCSSEKLTQDTDTFDTWFSSGQWPFATLMTAKKGDFEYFYPTSIMNTAYDILPFWVIRMIMLGLYKTGKIPFESVVIHGLVRDREGQKISKSKGNVIDPIVMSEKYGADALRMGLIWASLVENDIALSEDNIRGQRNFSNKLWNIARFVLMEKEIKNGSENKDDKKIKKGLEVACKKVTSLLDKNRLNEAAGVVYDFIWKSFANDYLEKTKNRRSEAQKTLEYILSQSLIMAHPFMPFVTEAIWQEGKGRFKEGLLISQKWPC